MCSNYSGIKLEPALGTYKIKLNSCHRMLTSSTQLQNTSFHVVERTKTSSKCQKKKNARIFHCQVCKFVGFLLPLSSWLLKPGFHIVVSVVQKKNHSISYDKLYLSFLLY